MQYTQVLFFNIPDDKRRQFEAELHFENLPIQISSASSVDQGWEKLKDLTFNGREQIKLAIIVQQDPALITELRKKQPKATILVWDKTISNPKAKKAGANLACNYSHRMTLWLLREIINLAEPD